MRFEKKGGEVDPTNYLKIAGEGKKKNKMPTAFSTSISIPEKENKKERKRKKRIQIRSALEEKREAQSFPGHWPSFFGNPAKERKGDAATLLPPTVTGRKRGASPPLFPLPGRGVFPHQGRGELSSGARTYVRVICSSSESSRRGKGKTPSTSSPIRQKGKRPC